MVETAVHLYKNGGSCLFYHINLYQKLPRFTNQKLARLKSQRQFFAVFFAEIIKAFAQFFSEFFHICFNIPFFVRNFKPASEVNKFKVFKIFRCIKKYFRSIQKNINI